MPPRVVLDTNCVLSALLFSSGRLAWLRDAWQRGQFVPLVNRDTASELLRVLSYPKFKLAPDEQETLLADFLPYAETVHVPSTPSGPPPIPDSDDVMFLALAVVAGADALVSGDGDIHAAKHALERVSVLTATEFADWLAIGEPARGQ